MSPFISIIIPIYNAEATLARCLNSILTQSLQDIEVLCVNDGSTDGSVDILKQFVAHDARIHVYSFEKNYGIVIAVKLALLNAKGKYVMFVDSDDVLLPGACENAARLIEKHDVDVLQFGVKINVPSGTDASSWQKTFAPKDWKSEGVNLLYDCYSLHRFPHNIWNKIYRREVCRAAVETMPELQVSQAADVLQTFFFLYYAKTFRSVTDGPYYEYFVGNGVSTRPTTMKEFAGMCACSAIPPAIEEFLKQENKLETHQFLVDSIRIILKSGMLSKLLTLPEITKETIDLAVKSWGSEILYDFIKAPGLLDVKCVSRYQLVTVLVNQIRNAAQPVPGMHPAQK
jgi:glycosyltransferase involved in cell wall biosynthesis